MIDESASRKHWDGLHGSARFRPRFPTEAVVRFVSGNFPEGGAGLAALDIGVGAGRHTKLLAEMGFDVHGMDISPEGIEHCRKMLADHGLKAELAIGSMHALSFPDARFHVAVSYGVFLYTNRAGLDRAVAEMHRVLRPGAPAFVMLRTTDDYRCGKGVEIEPQTFRLEIDETNELGTIQHFLSEQDVPDVFRAFSSIAFERTEVTFAARQKKNSDWLITVRK